jgi:hypothetical protein
MSINTMSGRSSFARRTDHPETAANQVLIVGEQDADHAGAGS